jgi:two-component sensor histidine kinase
MARQTLKLSGINRTVWDAFEGRLIAMSRAHDLLNGEDWVGADVVSIVAEALKVHTGTERASFDIDGPAALVDAQTALSLAMVLHELGTNALKYGALSKPGGRIAIRWQVEDDTRGKVFDLRWNEHGGPKLNKPAHRGFGSRLVEQAFSQHDIDHARLEFLPQGVQFRLRIVLPSDVA